MTPPFKGMKIEQEVLVRDLFPSFVGTTEKYDWVIKNMFTIIECHGKQHYSVQTFGKDLGDAILDFKAQKKRDEAKKEIALLNNWTYIEIPFSDEKIIDASYLLLAYEKYTTSETPVSISKEVEPANEYKLRQQERAKEYRQQQYQRSKEYKKSIKNK